MKIAQFAKILRAVEAKTSTAKTWLGEVRRRQSSLLDAAVAAEAEASTTPSPPQDAADLLAQSRRVDALRRLADLRRAEAASLEPRIADRKDALRAALREEIAWRRLMRRARADMEKRRASGEEERREAIVALRN